MQSELDWDAAPLADLPPLEPLEIVPPKPCLRCGRPGRKMFCSAKCRGAWIAGMERWATEYAKKRFVGSERNLFR